MVNPTKLNTKRKIFAIGTGRCGTNFLHKALKIDPSISSHHELDPLSDTFHRYFKWNELPIDHQGFLYNKEKTIASLAGPKLDFFESSAFLSLSVKELYEYFDARFIFLVRDPYKVVKSYLKKGWYSNEIQIANHSLPPSYQENVHFHHFLGRILPRGEEVIRWKKLTRVGKLAWYWSNLNLKVIDQLKELPNTHYEIIKLEELNYEKILSLGQKFFERELEVSDKKFDELRNKRPNNFDHLKESKPWTDLEKYEFANEVRELALKFQYKTEVPDKEKDYSSLKKKEQSFFQKLKSKLSR